MQDRICQIDENLLHRTAGPYIGSTEKNSVRAYVFRFSPQYGRRSRQPDCGDAFELALFAQVGLKLCEDAEHIEERLARGRAGIDRLLRRLEDRTLRFERADNILQIADAFFPISARRKKCRAAVSIT